MQESRVTIDDVAKASGVSKSAVSYALNGKPGVSERTRAKVLRVAEKMGWRPSSAAKALSNARTNNIGLILTRETELIGGEPWIMELIGGLGIELEQVNYSLLIRVAGSSEAELEITKDWIATEAVDGMLVLNVEIGDQRVRLHKQHPEMPVLFLAHPSLTSGLPTLWSDDVTAARLAVDYLHEQCHACIARVAGPEELGHTLIRDQAFIDEVMNMGMCYNCLHAGFTPESGADATRRLLSFPEPPTAIIYDNDAMAVAGLNVAKQEGIKVPEELSIMSWDDSFLCLSVTPSISAIGRNVVESGRMAAKLLIDVINGNTVESVPEPAYELRLRESTGGAPHRGDDDADASQRWAV